jgi:diguanylate cyclase (GGDEF)-like protein
VPRVIARQVFARGEATYSSERDSAHSVCANLTIASHGESHLDDAPPQLFHADSELLAALIEALPNLLMVFDRSGTLLRVNRPFQLVSAYPLNAGLQFSSLFQGAQAHQHWQDACSAQPLVAMSCCEFLTTCSGRRVPLQLGIVRAGEGATTLIIVSATDLRSQRAVERQLWRQAYFEPLTRLPNRAGFRQQLGLRMAGEFHQEDDLLAVAVLDVTRFRAINDVLGHEGGDALLQSLARRLKASLPDAVIGHLSAGEFAVLFADIRDENAALDAGQRVLELFREGFLIRSQRIVLEARVGVALVATRKDPASVMRDADSALFEAKEAGGNAVRVFDRSMRLASEARLRMDSELRLALAKWNSWRWCAKNSIWPSSQS